MLCRHVFAGVCMLAVLLVEGQVAAQTYRFVTVTGGRTGDEGPATQAYVGYPTGVVLDADGSIHVAEFYRQTIRRIDPDGTIHTVAGTGKAGFGGDGGPATQALIDGPQSLALDGDGSLYIADANNNRVRRIDSDGIITTFAGNGSASSSGDGGSALNAGLNGPNGLAFDAEGNLYVSERLGHRIRRVATDGTITTVAGTGTAGFSGDGGPGTEGQVNRPAGIGFDGAGNLYVAETGQNRIRRIAPDGTLATVLEEAPVYAHALAVEPDGTLYVGSYDCALYRVSSAGVARIAGRQDSCTYDGDGGWAVNAPVDTIEGLALSPNGDLYLSDSGNYRLRRISAGVIDTVAGVGGHVDGDSAVATFSILIGLSVGPDGAVYVADTYPNNRVRRIAPDGVTSTVAGLGYMATIGDGGPATAAGLSYPVDTDVDASGRVYIVDRLNNRIRRIGTDGIITTVAGSGPSGYAGDGGLATQAKLSRPRGVAVSADGTFYIADENNHRVRRVGTDGIITTVAGNGFASFGGDGGPGTSAALNRPQSLALDRAGNLYILDVGNARVRRLAPDGTITTYAGNGTGAGDDGLGGPATQAQLNQTTGIAVDRAGRLYLAGGSLRIVEKDGTMREAKGLEYPAYDVAVAEDGTVFIAVLGGRVLRGRRVMIAMCAQGGTTTCPVDRVDQ